jgi:hypothetical protein
VKQITFEYGDKTVQEFALLYKNGQLNLEPGFQRHSVWSVRDRQKLVLSILQNYPIPSVFLYERSDNGTLVYDVIDGKQRLESLFMYIGISGYSRDRFSLRARLGQHEDGYADWSWARLRKKGFEHVLMGYKIQTAEVSGDLSDIIDLFVRINSTGKALTSAEKRHARYYTSTFLKTSGRLADRLEAYFTGNRIISRTQVARMKHVELVSELMASVATGGLINKKTALDRIIGGQELPPAKLERARSEVGRVVNILRRMYPGMKSTRFANIADFYSLFMFTWKLDQGRCVLTNRKRNRLASDLLKSLSNGVDIVRDQQKKARGARPDQRMFADYLLTVQGDTDSLATRQRREAVLEKLLGGLFEKKDERRLFSAEQRRLIWNSEEKRRCRKCKRPLSWENYTLDHIKPYSLGGPTRLSNASLLCRSCNSRKGARR